MKGATEINGETKYVERKNVLFVPNLSHNLVSLGNCQENGVKVSFASNSYGRGTCLGEHMLTLNTVFHEVENEENRLYEAVLKTDRSNENAFYTKFNDSKL